MSEPVKLVMTWDIKPRREKVYFAFITQEFPSVLQHNGFQLTDAWYTMYGTWPQVRMGFVSEDLQKLEDFLLSELDSDEGARYLGEFAIGTNYGIKKFTKNILYDEKIGGSFHLALGASIPESGGKNVSGIHWDMICDVQEDSEIHVDGELLYKNGQFKI